MGIEKSRLLSHKLLGSCRATPKIPQRFAIRRNQRGFYSLWRSHPPPPQNLCLDKKRRSATHRHLPPKTFRFIRQATFRTTQANPRVCSFLLVKGSNCLGTCPLHVMTVSVGHFFEESGDVGWGMECQSLFNLPRDPGL